MKAKGEDDYIANWSRLTSRVEPYSYRFFSHYCGNDKNIVPEDIGHTMIESVLNPYRYRPIYEDKNMFPRLIGKEFLPRTVLCRINGSCLLTGEYLSVGDDINKFSDSLGGVKSVILKPTIGSSSGRGIIKFVRSGDDFFSADGNTKLTYDFLMSYGNDFCLQETVNQHEFMNRLNPTSVNTLRILLYRSIKDNRPILRGSLVRIGRKGSYLDNAHAGGRFVGIDPESGKLGKFSLDQYGKKSNIWNDIDFSEENLTIPNWDQVKNFVEYIGSRILHHRLIQLDIAIKNDGTPILIEYNIGACSFWLFMYVGQSVFGEYTDEVIEYAREKNIRDF